MELRLPRLWIFGPICHDERAAASESAALPRARRKRAARGGGPLHSPLVWSTEPIDHQPFVGFNARRPFRRAPPDNGGPNGVIRRHRSPSATQIRKPPAAPAWRIVTVEDQWARFVEDVPRHEQPVLSRAHFDEWSERYLDTDPDSRSRDPAGVKTPTGRSPTFCTPGTAISPMTRLWYRRRSRSSAANGMDSLTTRMRDGYSTLLLLRRSNATSRSAGARI